MDSKICVRIFQRDYIYIYISSHLEYFFVFHVKHLSEGPSPAGENPVTGALVPVFYFVCAEGMGEMLVLTVLSLFFFRVVMSKRVSWQPSKSWMLLRWVEEHSSLLAIRIKFNNERWHMAYLMFMLKGRVLARDRLLSVCRTWPLEPICPLQDFCALACRSLCPSQVALAGLRTYENT